MRVSVVQMNSQEDKAANLSAAERLVVEAADRPDLIVLPENFTYLGEGRERIRASAESFPDGEGLVVARSSDTVGSISASLDLAYQAEIRAKLPVCRHHVLG